jgi:hypothetical protein
MDAHNLPTMFWFVPYTHNWSKEGLRDSTTNVYPKVSGLSHNEIYAYNNKHSFRSNTQRVTAAKLTRLTHKIAI